MVQRRSLTTPMLRFAHGTLVALLIIALFGFLPAYPTPTYAAALVVTSVADTVASDGVCTLREAITNANSDAPTAPDCPAGNGADVISFSFATTTTITLAATLPAITSAVTISGTGSSALTLSGNDSVRILQVNAAGRLKLNSVTLRDGEVEGAAGANPGANGSVAQGGALFNSGTAELNDVVFLSNTVVGGAGAANTAPAAAGNGGDGQGGALYNAATGTLTATMVTFTDNAALGGGGGAGAFGAATAAGTAGAGGAGLGGALLNAGKATLIQVNITQNGTQGGSGGPGGSALNNTSSNGGRGGDGLGGAINNTGTLTISDSLLENNTATGGDAGNGGSSSGAIVTGSAGGAGGTAQGGAIRNSNGTLTIEGTYIRNNKALGGIGGPGGTGNPAGPGGAGGVGQGGGIRTNSPISISNSTIEAGEARGNTGGTGGEVITGSTGGTGGIGGTGQGGGLYATTAITMTATNSTFAANLAIGGVGGNGGISAASITGTGGNGGPGQGGALFVSGVFTATHLTISASEAQGSAGGIGGASGTPGASSGGGIYNFTGGNLAFYNSIAANSVRGGDCALAGGTIAARNGSLVEDLTCGFTTGGDPLLVQLSSEAPPVYGIPTTSPAVGLADQAFCAATDQRGLPRDSDCDSGASENQPPSTIDDTVTTLEDQPVSIAVLANDLELDPGDQISLLALGQPVTGTVALTATNQAVYTPTLNVAGTAVFTYTASDGLNTSTGIVTVTVTPVNDLPIISAIADQTTAYNRATAPISFTISDIETGAGELTLVGSSANTTLVPTANIVFSGSAANRFVTITPAAGQSGTTTITIIVRDADGGERSISFNLTVSGPPKVYLPLIIR
jgi:CSLREA domain-containing protein